MGRGALVASWFCVALRMLVRAGEVVVAGVDQFLRFGKGHMPEGWLMERQMEHLKFLYVLPAPKTLVAKVVSWIMDRHSLSERLSDVGGQM